MPLASRPANGSSYRPNLKAEVFTTVKFLIRYTNRLKRVMADDRWREHRAELAEIYDAELEKMQQIINQTRDEFAAGRAAAKQGGTDGNE